MLALDLGRKRLRLALRADHPDLDAEPAFWLGRGDGRRDGSEVPRTSVLRVQPLDLVAGAGAVAGAG